MRDMGVNQYEIWEIWVLSNMKYERCECWAIWNMRDVSVEQYEIWYIWMLSTLK